MGTHVLAEHSPDRTLKDKKKVKNNKESSINDVIPLRGRNKQFREPYILNFNMTSCKDDLNMNESFQPELCSRGRRRPSRYLRAECPRGERPSVQGYPDLRIEHLWL